MHVSSKVLILSRNNQSNKNNGAYPVGNRETYILLGDKYLVLLPQCLLIGVADFLNVFVKPNEQNRACSSYAMARKRRMKSNLMYHVCEWLFFMA